MVTEVFLCVRREAHPQAEGPAVIPARGYWNLYSATHPVQPRGPIKGRAHTGTRGLQLSERRDPPTGGLLKAQCVVTVWARMVEGVLSSFLPRVLKGWF